MKYNNHCCLVYVIGLRSPSRYFRMNYFHIIASSFISLLFIYLFGLSVMGLTYYTHNFIFVWLMPSRFSLVANLFCVPASIFDLYTIMHHVYILRCALLSFFSIYLYSFSLYRYRCHVSQIFFFWEYLNRMSILW